MPVPSSFTDLDENEANNSPPGTESAKGNVDNYLRQAFAFIKQNRNFMTALLGTDSSDKAAARTALGVGNAPRVSGLRGNVNATTPLTQYDLSADSVTLRDANGATVTRYTSGTIICDLGLAGSAANGRDQSGAFTANSWIYLYFIWNGTTLATIASLSATTPTLPTGYTHYAFATALRWNASSNIVPCRARGRRVNYDVQQIVVNGGAAAVATAVSLTPIIPPNALDFLLSINSLAASTSAAGVLDMQTFIESTAGSVAHSSRFAIVAAANSAQYGAGPQLTLPNINQSYNYYSTVSTGSGPSIVESVNGYSIANGDA